MAVASTEQQFSDFMKIVGRGYGEESSGGKGGGGGKGGKEILFGKDFARLDKFGGEDKKWKEWAFGFKMAVRKNDEYVHGEITWMENEVNSWGKKWKDDVYERYVGNRTDLIDPEEKVRWVKASNEICTQLCFLTSGEANVIVRSAVKQSGFVAWRKLTERYDAKTPAKMLRNLMRVIRPEMIKNVKDVPRKVEEWEISRRDLMVDDGERISDGVALAVFLSMIPKDLQDEVYRSVEGEDGAVYSVARDKVVGIAGSRIMQDTPTPMDIGNVGTEEEGEWGWEEEEPWGELEVDSVGKGGIQCWGCGGFGHTQRDCFSKGKGKGGEKGKGKGQFGKGKGDFGNWKGGFGGKGNFGKGGKGKGYGKGDYWGGSGKGDSWGTGKGMGKGFGKNFGGKGDTWIGMNSQHITCYKCGERGHKADSCKGVSEVGFQGEGEGGEKCIDGVWMIA